MNDSQPWDAVHGTGFTLERDGTTLIGQTQPLISCSCLTQYEQDWQPILQREAEEDADWSWRDLVNELTNGESAMSLICEERCQAMMILSRSAQMRGPRDGGESCCYVKNFASAPWNRKTIAEKPGMPFGRLKPAGSCLMLRAIEISINLGFGGRLAWCSKLGAVDDYRRMFPGVVTTGLDPDEQLDWYEIGVREAAAFIRQMEPKVQKCY